VRAACDSHVRVTRTVLLARFAALVGLAATLTTLAACSGGGGGGGGNTKRQPSTPTATPSTPPLVSTITPDLATAIASTARAITAVTSYDYRRLGASHTSAMRYLAEPFRSKYESAWPQVQTRAPKVHMVVTGKIDNVGLSEVAPDRMVALVFSQQTVTNTSTTRPQVQANALRVTMTLSSGSWLLSELGEIGPTSAGDSAKTAWAAPGLAAAVLAGRQCVATLQTVDARNIDAQLATMQQCTTGELLSALKAKQDQLRQAAARASSTATVVAAGVSTASPDHVSLLVALATKSTPRGGSPTNRLTRLLLTLQQDSGRWLVSNLESVGVQ
jgi:hypothetical protein